MQTILLRCCLFLALVPLAAAQTYPPPGWHYGRTKSHVELVPFAGILIPDSDLNVVDHEGRPLKLDSALVAGFRLALNLSEHASFEGSLGFSPSSLVVDEEVLGGIGNLAGGELAGVDLLLYSGGFSYDFLDDSVRPFVTFGLGAIRFDSRLPGVGPDTDFAIDVGGGVKFYASEHIGVRLEIRDHVIPSEDRYDYGYGFCCGKPDRDHLELSGGLILGF
jgi:opacity protein-like surface antigen